jgi:uncharacterized protein
MTAVMERTLAFDCEGDVLVGILHESLTVADLGIVVIVGGPQYRAGSHRQFVLLARAIANAGFPVLRFDSRGMGDSGGKKRDFEHMTGEVSAAIAELKSRVLGVQRIVLLGLCDGASAALLYLDETDDERVSGLCLLNPWVRSEPSLARTHLKHYYVHRLSERAFWVKLVRGGVGLKAWRELMTNVRNLRSNQDHEQLSFQRRMARGWANFAGDILLVLSGRDITAQEFLGVTLENPAWAAALRHSRLQRQDLADADHTFSSEDRRQQVEMVTVGWLRAMSGRRPSPL